MACAECGTVGDDLHYRCSYCQGKFCNEHRLPESHNCDGVQFLSDAGKRFESKASGEVVKEGDTINPPKPFKPKYTVGNTPEWKGNPSPDTVLKKDVPKGETAERQGLLKRLFHRLR